MRKPVISGDMIITPSDQEYLTDIDAFLEGTLRGLGASESVIADIAISVSEIVNNAMIHGNKSSLDKSVTVKIIRENGSVTIIISDEGGGFDLGEIPNPLSEENLMKEVGRGLFIVRSLMDEVDIKAGETGTVVSVTKSI